jgi:hypothetical protein
LTTGAWFGRNRLSRIQIGSVVVLWLAVKRVTMISSKLSANASSPPASSAVRSNGKVTRQKVVKLSAPRSIDASSRSPPRRRSRAMTLLKTTTTQNVACATTSVSRDSGTPRIVRKALFSAMPVTMPGNAIGRITSSDTASRPKNLYRCSDIAASVPSTSATAVDSRPTTTEVRSASSAPALCAARDHHCRVKPAGGQPNARSLLNELITTTISGT